MSELLTNIGRAAAFENSDALQSLLAKLDTASDIDTCSFGKLSPLILAAMNGNTENVKLLLEKEANVNKVCDGTTALIQTLHSAIPTTIDILDLLLQKNPDETIKDKYGHTALWTVDTRSAQFKEEPFTTKRRMLKAYIEKKEGAKGGARKRRSRKVRKTRRKHGVKTYRHTR